MIPDAPTPSPAAVQIDGRAQMPVTQEEAKSSSAVTVTIAGCGGCGINLARHFANDDRLDKVYNFDTSKTNVRGDEKVNILTNGSGSGSNRAENARDIERTIPHLTDAHVGLNDVVILIFSGGGGSGSVIAPIMLRNLVQRGARVIGVIVPDTSSAVEAKNTLNTFKTLTAICKHNEITLPLIVLTNDQAKGRSAVDDQAKTVISDLITLLTHPVYEVDRNDRLNWVNSSKVTGSAPGLKILSVSSESTVVDNEIALGRVSDEMVDSLLILQNSPADQLIVKAPHSRLKKTGFFVDGFQQVVGTVSSDISAIEKIIDRVEHMQTKANANKHQGVSRLDSSDSTELFL